MKAHKVSR
uniref:Uncharacterized protein n=1 Tax=Anguilla anguilla TaxID=7936 RepID=A0A0E9SM38_ANGAN